jgi:hypothetical protein
MTSDSAPTVTTIASREASTPARRVWGILRTIAGLTVFVAIAFQIYDKVTHDVFVPSQYFAYFTIQSGLMNVVVLLVGGWLALRWKEDPELFTATRMSVLSYSVVTGVVYNLLLRNIPSTLDYEGPTWPTEVTHVWIPLFLVVDWLLAPGRARLAWSRLWFVVVYPVAWLVFTFLRRLVDGWIPYPFLKPDGPGGLLSVGEYVIGITVFILAIGCAAIALSRVRPAPVVEGH